jgi:hypothetical protein
MAAASPYNCPVWARYAVFPKYSVPNKVDVPSAALGVNMGESQSVKSFESKKSRIAFIISCRTFKMAC